MIMIIWCNLWPRLYVLITRQSEGHDCHNKTMSHYIISTYGDLSLSEALDAFVSSLSHGTIASCTVFTIEHL
jgi:hypothetical protein